MNLVDVPKQKKSIWKRWYMFIAYFLVGMMILGAFLPNQDFENGMNAYNNKNYKEAYNLLSVVKSDDEGYKQAQSLLPDLKIKVDSINALEAKEEVERLAYQKTKDSLKLIEKAKEERADKVEALFKENVFGIPNKLYEYLEVRLKDPGSFTVQDVQCQDNGVTIAVLVTFRAKNSFGALTLQQAKAVVTDNGTVISCEVE